MPWDHAAFSYVAFSLFLHAVYRESPTASQAIVVVFASLLPDLVDKPLAWQFGVLEGGRTLGHSIFLAVPLSVAIGLFARSRGTPLLGWAFAFGYLLHLPGDVIPPFIRQGELKVDIVLWPVTDGGGGTADSFYREVMRNVAPYAHRIATDGLEGNLPAHLWVVLGVWVFTLLLWVYDGMPVFREGYHLIRRIVASAASR